MCNGNDDDCDGYIDEYCPPKYYYALIQASGTITKGHGIFVTTTSNVPGVYKLNAGPYHCGNDNVPLFLTAQSRFLHSITYGCNPSNPKEYIVHTSARITTALADTKIQHANLPFLAVLPPKTGNWAFVHTSTCKETACLKGKGPLFQKNKIKPSRNGLMIEFQDTQLCKRANPIFATLQNTTAVGFVSSFIDGNFICRASAFDYRNDFVKGARIGLWIPDLQKAPWATITAQPSFSGRNLYKQIPTGWSIRKSPSMDSNDCPGATSCARYQVTFPGWTGGVHSRTALLSSYTPSFGQASFSHTSYGIISSFQNASGVVGLHPVSVLFFP